MKQYVYNCTPGPIIHRHVIYLLITTERRKMGKRYTGIKEWHQMVTLIHRKKQREPGQVNKKVNTGNLVNVYVFFFFSLRCFNRHRII